MIRHFHVEHLRYEHSDVGLRKQLRRMPGIHDVVTDPIAGSATITFDASCCGPREVERMIEECGYRCRCASSDAGNDRDASGTRAMISTT